jgi:protein phosphatase
MWLEIGGSTDKGKVRSENQDAYCTIIPPVAPPGVAGVLAVADGMGGHQGGATASRIAIETVVELFTENDLDPDATLMGSSNSNRVSGAIRLGNVRVRDMASSPQLAGMGTTMTVVSLKGRTLSVGHVGDSRAYLVRNGGTVQLTRDHSWVAEQVASGDMTAEEAESDRRRSVLTRAVGIEADVTVDQSDVDLEPGDLIVLCSDGLHGRVSDSEIARVASENSPERTAKELVRLANAAGGQDNITVVVGRVIDQEPPKSFIKRLLRRSDSLNVVTG